MINYKLDDVNEEGSLEEGYDDAKQDQHALGYDDDPTKDVLQETVEFDDVANNADESYTDDDTMSITDDDDDDDMANPYNIDSRFDDIDVELDDVVDNADDDYTDDDTMSVTDDADDDDMTNPYNVDSRSYDIDDDLDEEDDDMDEDDEIY